LKGDWAFDGLVMSDWWGTNSTVAAANAGLDLEMPGLPSTSATGSGCCPPGAVAEAVVDDKVRRLLRWPFAPGRSNRAAETSVDDPAHRALIREAAAEGMVLLTNREGALPLDADSLGSLAVIGPNAANLTVLGGGSSRVEPHHLVQPLEACSHRRCRDRHPARAGLPNRRVTPHLSVGARADRVRQSRWTRTAGRASRLEHAG
jgi:beta-glucosidase